MLNAKINTKYKMKKIIGLVILGAMFFTWFVSSNVAFASENEEEDTVSQDNASAGIDYESLLINYKSDYNQVVFNSDNGIKSIEVNAISQTPDGFIWIGSYAGLYRYDGTNFQEMNLDSRISSVTCFFVDSNGKLWIGTNDKGIVVYDAFDSTTISYTTENGLASNSIRCICEDKEGNIFIGTSSYLCKLNADGTATSYENLSDITFVTNLFCADNGVVYGSTNEGGIFAIKNDELIAGGYYIGENFLAGCVADCNNENIVVGTVGGDLLVANKNNLSNIKLFAASEKIGGLTNISKVLFDEEEGCFICADNGFGYLDRNGNFQNLKVEKFSGAASDVFVDYQDNVWFTSSKYGVCKLSYNPFSDIFKLVGLDSTPVNAISKSGDLIYIATDNGLHIINEKTKKIVVDESLSFLSDVRIRDIYKDSKGNLWFSSYTSGGIVKLEKDGTVKRFGEEEGAIGTKYRSTIEMPDGTIAEASNLGITFIKNDKVAYTLGENEGMLVPQILCMHVGNDGELLAGSDGDGIYIIKDGKLIGRKGLEEGLEALVILRIVKATEGFIYVCSDALYYDNGETIIKLDNFPYTNNYDVYISADNEAWVSSSAGLFVVNADELVKNENYAYILLNKYNGFDTTLVANAWNYVDENENLYFCCSNGVKKLNIPEYGKLNSDYNIYVYEAMYDEEKVVLPSNIEDITVPAGVNRVAFSAAILNYSLSNPVIHVYLEGFDDTGIIMNQSEMSEISFTNIPYGSYKLHVQVLDEVDRSINRELVIPVYKEAEFYETTVFRGYLFLVICFILFFTAWLLAKYGSINELKYQYDETRKAKEESEKANKAKGQFLAKMSHEIRTPINAILGMDELIMKEDVSDNVYANAEDIKSSATALLAMINDLLDFSKIESNKMHLVEQEYRLDHLLDGIAMVLNSDASRKGLEPIIEVDSKLPAVLVGDEGRIRQILLNLVSNAIKYTEKGKVTLGASLVNKNEENKTCDVRFSVRDTGIGIKPEEKDKLFESFERIDEKRNAGIQGTGLGLPITKELSKLMGSDIEVESTYGEGSEFSFVLTQKTVSDEPIGKYVFGHAKRVKKAEKREASFKAPSAKILVVDDNSINRKVVKGLLKDTECQIEMAVSGMECLEKVVDNKYDIILLDHMMPEMDGVETLEKLKDSTYFDRNTPVLALTANAIEGAKEEYLSYGFTDYITKPVSGEALEAILVKYIPEDKITYKK